MSRCGPLSRAFVCLLLAFSFREVLAQGVAACKPMSQRTQEVGCWIAADEPLGKLAQTPVFWHLDVYPTRAAATADKGSRGTVIESLGKVWLMTVDNENWRSRHGERIAEIGPLSVITGTEYYAQYMEAVFMPGMIAPAHVHSGPEAWYTLAGETCLETSDGRVQVGRAGAPPVIAPMGLSMHLTATGTDQRRALVLILHQSSEPATTLVHDWTPKGLCKR